MNIAMDSNCRNMLRMIISHPILDIQGAKYATV
jgi:hypothetical protein